MSVSADSRSWTEPHTWLWVAGSLVAGHDWQAWMASGEQQLEQLAATEGRTLGTGRGAARAVSLDEEHRGVWRINRHGGLLGGLQGDRYRSPKRLQEEVELSEGLRADGILTPRVLLALACKEGGGWRQHLVTEEVADAETVFQARDCQEAMDAAAALLAQVFELGLWAKDLHPDNLLWRAPDQTCWLLDLAGAKRFDRPLDAAQRQARVDRFLRYFRKHAGSEPATADVIGALGA